ncbi:uncharacterized protein ARMOST_21276 [Armillaria ostoyae]|uniref:Uncharacterized protein n=1 Tax=Armillaria ostoyae TaxID=47428 RepID=A0A284S9S1_ARMOS|nr:uncharacterized protein ARMOST_21276 [Armillaria ostoyae]
MEYSPLGFWDTTELLAQSRCKATHNPSAFDMSSFSLTLPGVIFPNITEPSIPDCHPIFGTSAFEQGIAPIMVTVL